MTRNQKIALGCGGAGCLGLIVVAVAGVLIYYYAYNRTYSTNRNDDDNFNITTNRNSNSNDSDSNDNDNSSSSSSSSASAMSDDDKHKLYQAALMTGDPELVRRVSVKLDLMDDDYTPGDNYQSFVTAHVSWVIRNSEFASTINTPEKARTYVDQNMPN